PRRNRTLDQSTALFSWWYRERRHAVERQHRSHAEANLECVTTADPMIVMHAERLRKGEGRLQFSFTPPAWQACQPWTLAPRAPIFRRMPSRTKTAEWWKSYFDDQYLLEYEPIFSLERD